MTTYDYVGTLPGSSQPGNTRPLPSARGVLNSVCSTEGAAGLSQMIQYIGFNPTYAEHEQTHWFPIEPERHVFVAGETGTGKSTFFVNATAERMVAGDSILVVDPHGPLAEEIANRVPRHRLNDVIYFDPTAEHPLSLNPFDHPDRALARSLVKDLIEKTWPQGWGPQTDDIITFVMLALQDVDPLPTLPLAQRFLRSAGFRKHVLQRVRDTETLAYFEDVFDGDWDKRMRAEKSAPVFNKLNKFVNEPVLRAIFSGKRSLDIRHAIDNRAILIFNLAQSKIGRPNTAFIGGIVAFKHQQALLSRQDQLSRGQTPPKSYAYYDEFQVVMGADISVYLAESRKYGGCLMLATQSFSMLPEQTRHLVMANCGTQVLYRLSREDAEVFARDFGDDFAATALTKTIDYHCYVNTVRRHVPQKPMLVRAFSPAARTGREPGLPAILKRMTHHFGTTSERTEQRKGELR